jgi:ADP-heptose:LPS heptosyltransferase
MGVGDGRWPPLEGMASGFTEWWKERRRVHAIRSARVASRSQHLTAADRALGARPRILILKLDHIGDFVLTMRAMLQLRQAWPDAHMTLVCGPWNVEMAQRLGVFDRIVAHEFFPQVNGGVRATASERQSAFAALDLGEPFDLAVDLRYDHDTRCLLEVVDTRFRAGYAARGLKAELDLALPTTETNSRRRRPLATVHAELRSSLLAAAIVEVFGPREMHPLRTAVAGADVDSALVHDPYIVVATGARKATCKWPIANFVELCTAFADNRQDTIVLIGDRHDRADARTIADALPAGRARDLTGQTTIEQLPLLLSKASLFIGNDTGTTHIAAKLGIPTICIFSGTSDHRVWQPTGANARTIRCAIDCSPCHLDRREECPVGVKCLTLISVDEVLDTALAMLDETDRNRSAVNGATVAV